jgi:rod shape determining protein RodA
MLIGWTMIFASEYQPENYQGIFDLNKNYGKQFLWILTGLGLGISTQFIEGKFYQSFAFVFYGLAILLLIAVLFTAPIKGATSWFNLGGFRLQPSEFAKTATNLALGALLAMPDVKMTNLQGRLQAFGLLGLPIILIVLQPDAGSMLVFCAFLLVLFRAGLSAWIYIIGLSLAALSIAALMVDQIWGILLFITVILNGILLQNWKKDNRWLAAYILIVVLTYIFYSSSLVFIILGCYLAIFLGLAILNLIKRQWQVTAFSAGGLAFAALYSSSVNYMVNKVLLPHQQERIWVWLRPEKCDPLGPLYNLEQSKFAIGSGGLTGKGFLEGERTKLDYVPEQSTDFIFCTVGEEWGFLGSSVVIILFCLLILRILHIAERQRSVFSKFYAYGVACILIIHVLVNIGMTMGLLPVIGIPLPFISYGGSSLFSFLIMLGILFKLDSQRMMVFR